MSEQEETTIESLAIEQGWRPDFEGEGAKTAAEYIRHSTTIDKKKSITIEGQNNKIDELSNAMSKMQETFNATVEQQNSRHAAELESKMAKLEEQKETAIDEADGAEVKRIEKKMAAVESQKKETVKSTPQVTKEQKIFEDWHADKAGWLTKGSTAEKEMMKAISNYRIDRGYPADKIVDVNEELSAATEALKKKYPANFGIKPEEKPPGGSVGEGGTKSGSVTKELKVSDLTPEESKEYKTYERLMGKNFNSKTMLKNIANMQAARSV